MAGDNHCPITPYYEVNEVAHSKQLSHRQFFVDTSHPVAGKLTYPLSPDRLSQTPAALSSPAPLLGEHNEEVYCEQLKFSKQELVRFREAGVI